MEFLINDLDECTNKLLNLEKQKIYHIQTIEQLTSKIAYQTQLIDRFTELRKESEQSTKSALFDLGNKLSKQLIEIHQKENKQVRDASREDMSNISQKFNTEFERLVTMVGSLNNEISQSKDTVDLIKNSLLSPSGAGSLAEITLENILKASGLRSNLDFFIQHTVTGVNDETLRPDAVIFLPNDNLMIVDAKASKFLMDNKDQAESLSKTMNYHIRSLSSKDYSDAMKKSVRDKSQNIKNIVTLMFLPSEHAIEKLTDADSNFMEKAWKLNIFPVGPSGLMNMLSFAKFQISEQMMIANHEKIIQEVEKLIASISSVTEHASKFGNSISTAVSHYDKFAASFNHNFLSKVRNISKMGIGNKTQKNQDSLKRLQIVTSQSELIEVESSDKQHKVSSEIPAKLEPMESVELV